MNLLGPERVLPTGGEPPKEVCALVAPRPVQRKFAMPNAMQHRKNHDRAEAKLVGGGKSHHSRVLAGVGDHLGSAVLNQKRLPGDE